MFSWPSTRVCFRQSTATSTTDWPTSDHSRFRQSWGSSTKRILPPRCNSAAPGAAVSDESWKLVDSRSRRQGASLTQSIDQSKFLKTTARSTSEGLVQETVRKWFYEEPPTKWNCRQQRRHLAADRSRSVDRQPEKFSCQQLIAWHTRVVVDQDQQLRPYLRVTDFLSRPRTKNLISRPRQKQDSKKPVLNFMHYCVKWLVRTDPRGVGTVSNSEITRSVIWSTIQLSVWPRCVTLAPGSAQHCS